MRLAVIMLLILMAAGPVFAYQVGPFDMEFGAAVTESYDDNITSASTDTKDDYVTSASVGATALYEEKLKKLLLGARVSHQFYQQYSGYDNTAEYLTASYDQEFSAYERLKAGAEFTHAEEPASFDDEFGGVSGRYSYNRGRLNTAFTRDVTQEFSWTGRFAAEVNDYSRADLTDSYLYRLGATGQFIASAKTTLSAMYDFYWREFDPGPDATIHSFGGGLRQYFSGQLYLDCAAGYDFINSYNRKDYIKPFLSVRLTNEIDKDQTVYAGMVKQYTTTSSTQDLFDQWRFFAGYNHQLFPRLTGRLSVFYGEGSYSLLNIDDTFEGLNAGLSYDLFEDIQLTAGYAYSKTDSNRDSRDYKKNVYSAGVKARF